MISEPYRVGKYHIDGRSRYGLFFNSERLGWFDNFEDCQVAAEMHAATGSASYSAATDARIATAKGLIDA